MTSGEVAVKNIRDCRAMSSLFRQFAVFDPVHSSKYLIEAQRWEHLAQAEITSHFEECNTTAICHRPNGARRPHNLYNIRRQAIACHCFSSSILTLSRSGSVMG